MTNYFPSALKIVDGKATAEYDEQYEWVFAEQNQNPPRRIYDGPLLLLNPGQSAKVWNVAANGWQLIEPDWYAFNDYVAALGRAPLYGGKVVKEPGLYWLAGLLWNQDGIDDPTLVRVYDSPIVLNFRFPGDKLAFDEVSEAMRTIDFKGVFWYSDCGRAALYKEHFCNEAPPVEERPNVFVRAWRYIHGR